MFAAFISLSGPVQVAQFVNQLGVIALGSDPKRNQKVWCDDNVALIQQQLTSLNKAKIFFHPSTNLRLISWSRIDNKLDLKHQLQSDLINESSSDEEFVLASYLKWGEHCCEHLIGDFSFLIYNQSNGDIFFARDQIGARPLYFYQDSSSIFVASSVEFIKSISQFNGQLNQEWLARYIIDRSQDWSKTIYEKIKKVPPAHFFYYNLNEENLSHKRYFEFKAESSLILKNDDEYVEAYKEKLNQAVKCRLKSDNVVGSELSGGLDSSTVTALVAKNIQDPGKLLHTFGGSESAMAMDCVYEFTQHVPMTIFHFLTCKNQNYLDPYIENQCYGMPIDNGNASASSAFYSECQRLGIDRLFSGFGGDEFVTSEAPVALIEFWNDKSFLLFLSRQRGNWLTKPLHTLRWIYLYYKHKNKSITSRRLTAAGELDWSINPLKESIIKSYDIESKYFSALKYDAEKKTQNEFAIQDRMSPYLVARLETSALIAAHYRVENQWPLLDVRLLEFFLSVPASQKLGPGLTGRYLHRRAVTNLLPRRLSTKSKDMISISFVNRLYSALISNARFMFDMKKQAKQNHNFRPTRQISEISSRASNIKISSELEPILDKSRLMSLTTRADTGSAYEKQFAARQLVRINRLSQWIETDKNISIRK